ncbi:MAG: glycosyltransferase family 39 protein [Pyrinomonadaceae bacterium]|nr:glycosyltransferase family 39 protein [Pyrinomonadaceae bacterium]MBP6213348.1 glycosyltransferase family 39 protein [Pyrinomonadaceae bacterium]
MAATATKPNSSTGIAAIGFAVFAIVLLAAFFANRGADVGQLGTLAGNLAGGPLFGFEGLRDSVVGSLAAAIIGISWFGLGSFVFSFIKIGRSEAHSHLLELATKIAIGAAIWSCVWFFLGLAGAYSAVAAIGSVVVGLLFAAASFRRVREAKAESRVPEKPSGFDKALLLLIAVPLGLAFVAALAPPTAKDTLLYHFALPKAFIAQGSNAFVEGNIASYLALGTEMHIVWAMLLGRTLNTRAGEIAASVSLFLFFPILLMAIFGWARETGISRRWSLFAVLMVASVPTAYHVASSGYIDLSLALFVTLTVYTLSRWWKEQTIGAVVTIAILLGAALTIKLTTVFVIAAFALIVLLRARGAENPGKIVAGGFAALVLAGAIASPWYLRTWAATGSPVFPFYMSIWPGEANGWDVERSNLFQGMNSQYGGTDVDKANYLTAPVRVSVMAQPERPVNYDGVLGISFLLGLPLLIWAAWKLELPLEAKIAAGVAGVMYLFWLFSSAQLRYLLPIVPALAIAIAASAEGVAGRVRDFAQYAFAAAAIAAIATSAAWFCQKAPLRVVLGGETRDYYLARNLDYYYPFYRVINSETKPDDRVWLINMRRDTYHIDRPVFSDYLFEDWTFRKLLWQAKDIEDLRKKTEAMHVKYVLARHDFLFDYEKTTLVDDTKSRSENEAKLKIAKEFLLPRDCVNTFDSKFSLNPVGARGCGNGDGDGVFQPSSKQ